MGVNKFKVYLKPILAKAIDKKDAKAIKFFIKDLGLNANDALVYAAKTNNIAVVKLIHKIISPKEFQKFSQPLIEAAVGNSDTTKLEFLIKKLTESHRAD